MLTKEDMQMYNKMTKKQLIQEIKRFDRFIDFMCNRQIKLYPPDYIMDENWPNTSSKWTITSGSMDGTTSCK